jgi:prepilin-type N-terminal cleavage/methylation domain-containing protein
VLAIKRPSEDQGFTLIELLVVVIIIAVLAAVTVPLLWAGREKAIATDCLVERTYADKAQVLFTCEYGIRSEDTATLAAEGLLSEVPVCPSGGTYSWTEIEDRSILTCSIHAQPQAAAPLTPLGSTFGEITGGLVALIDAFYANRGRYPRSWGEFVWTDIGLDPADWQEPAKGIIYKPGGNRVSVQPAPGYIFEVRTPGGNTRTLNNKLSWNLVYSNAARKWYYHTIDPANEIDINTLVVRPQ